MKKLVLFIAVIVVVLAGGVLVRTAMYRSNPSAVERVAMATIREGAAERLAGSLRIATISHEDPSALDAGAFRALHGYLREA